MARKTHKKLKDGTLMTWPLCHYHQKRWLAVMDYRNVLNDATDKEIEKVLAVYSSYNPNSGYVTYTDLRKSGLSYPRIFAVCKTLHQKNPRQVKFSVNRMSENTCVNLRGCI